jgi:hypothetical protein
MDRLAACRQRRFANAFAERWVRVDRLRDLERRRFEGVPEGDLSEEFAGLGADRVEAE